MDEVFFLNRAKAALYVETKYGARVSPDTLAKMAVYGNGPPYRLIGRTAVYEPADLDTWAQARLSAKMHSTAANPRDPFRRKPGRSRKPIEAA